MNGESRMTNHESRTVWRQFNTLLYCILLLFNLFNDERKRERVRVIYEFLFNFE